MNDDDATVTDKLRDEARRQAEEAHELRRRLTGKESNGGS